MMKAQYSRIIQKLNPDSHELFTLRITKKNLWREKSRQFNIETMAEIASNSLIKLYRRTLKRLTSNRWESLLQVPNSLQRASLKRFQGRGSDLHHDGKTCISEPLVVEAMSCPLTRDLPCLLRWFTRSLDR